MTMQLLEDDKKLTPIEFFFVLYTVAGGSFELTIWFPETLSLEGNSGYCLKDDIVQIIFKSAVRVGLSNYLQTFIFMDEFIIERYLSPAFRFL